VPKRYAQPVYGITGESDVALLPGCYCRSVTSGVTRVAPLLVVVAVGLALAVSACGSARSTGYHNPHYPYGAPNVPASLSKCMRANGVPNFPDPIKGPGGEGLPMVTSSPGTLTVEGVPLAGPAFAAAQKACQEYLPPSGPPPALSASQKREDLADAACMRRHGLSNFPDPTFNNGGESLAFPPGLSPQSPAFQQAAQACGLHGIGRQFSSG